MAVKQRGGILDVKKVPIKNMSIVTYFMGWLILLDKVIYESAMIWLLNK